ncbi:cytochrome P450 [Gautieria morchelliformis]|nr:cytochrome P450 [Gautieria morchelliformis]
MWKSLKSLSIPSYLDLLLQRISPMGVLAWTTNIYIALGGVIGAAFLLLVTQRTRIPEGTHLPPGPPGKAIIGNVYDMPKEHEWETYTDWAKKYGMVLSTNVDNYLNIFSGELVYVNVLRQPIVIVNSLAVAQDLFEKRSSIYSDRFDFPMAVDLAGFDWSFALMRYGNKWRRLRKMFHQKFHLTAATAYTNVQAKHTQELLHRLHESPEDFLQHFRHLSGAIIMEVIYGIKVLPIGDPYIRIAEQAMEAVSELLNPGSFLVDTLPICTHSELKYVPEWMPGAGFKTKARVWRQVVTQALVVPFNACKKALREGKAIPSFTASLLEGIADLPEADVPQQEDAIQSTGAAAYLAGADTTTVALSWFILAMILYPDVQRKAQRELDEVVGADRLPTFEDRDSLLYMNAICKEIQRWRPVAPLAIAHGVTQDDVYNNNFIPEGSVVIGNAWPGVRDPSVSFGFGRRICPGRHLADNTIYLTACFILKAFTISYAKDANGAEIPIEGSSTSGGLPRPEPFQCSMTPREGHLLSFWSTNRN